MNSRPVCFIKLFLITALSATLLASVETAPDQPLLFAAVSAACVIAIRALWRSIPREEKTDGKQKIPLGGKRRTDGKLPPDLKRAA